MEVGPAGETWGHLFTVRFGTSRRQFAGSAATVLITFFGERAVSDVHDLQRGFAAGARDSVDIRLNREIGELEKIRCGVQACVCIRVR